MSDINNNNMLSKEHLMISLEEDKIKLDTESIRKAKNDDGPTLNDIGYEYYTEKQNYSKAMSWYRLAAKQGDLNARINIGILYLSGMGVPQDCFSGMEYFLKVAVHNHSLAMDNIAHCFMHGLCVPADKYKALEWFVKCGNAPEKVEELHRQGIYLRKKDKNKTVYELAIETKNIMREERRKRDEELLDLRESKSLNEEKINKLENELQQSHHQITLFEKERQEEIIEKGMTRHIVNNLQQQVKDKTDIIGSLQQEIQVYRMLLQSKNNEIQAKSIEVDLIKKNIQIERENLKLTRKIRDSQGCSQEPRSWCDKHDSAEKGAASSIHIGIDSQEPHRAVLHNNVNISTVKRESDAVKDGWKSPQKPIKRIKL